MEQIKQPRLKKITLDLGMKLIGCTALYWTGQGVGEVMDYIPVVNHYVPKSIAYFSGINVEENLNGLVGLMGIAIGLKTSGIKTEFQKLDTTGLYEKALGEKPPEVEEEKIVSLNMGVIKLEDKIQGLFD